MKGTDVDRRIILKRILIKKKVTGRGVEMILRKKKSTELYDQVRYCWLLNKNSALWKQFPKLQNSIRILRTILSRQGHAVAQLVEALCYKPKGRGFDSRWSQ